MSGMKVSVRLDARCIVCVQARRLLLLLLQHLHLHLQQLNLLLLLLLLLLSAGVREGIAQSGERVGASRQHQ